MEVTGEMPPMAFQLGPTYQIRFRGSINMSKVVFILEKIEENKTEVIKILRAGLGIEIGRITKLAGSGKPLVVKTLFDRSEPTFAEKLHNVFNQLDSVRAGYKAYEILDEQEFSKINPANLYQITSERLKKMIETWKNSMQEQFFLDDSG